MDMAVELFLAKAHVLAWWNVIKMLIYELILALMLIFSPFMHLLSRNHCFVHIFRFLRSSFFCLFSFLWQVHSFMYLWLAWNSLWRLRWPWTHWSVSTVLKLKACAIIPSENNPQRCVSQMSAQYHVCHVCRWHTEWHPIPQQKSFPLQFFPQCFRISSEENLM